ncbi:aminomethyl transferase family protein [Bacillus sp. CH30_1T]|uniref:aminomethyltransferase family protein n=1 Tax=Bacillus sp. CH30_1T TaxID=2604836 RepID=UPI0011F094C9|nr:glycine cleavage T C-terminal barrel domain-containing protein [Bacillus sp. CH30_1T]KAA0560847.1 aminomethyl transferase family protein [Bacillus sp. CH30_1T]
MITSTDKKAIFTNSIKGNATVLNNGGYEVVGAYSGVEEEYNALRKYVGLIDYSSNGKFKITGEDHVEFVNYLTSMDIEYLDIEKTAFSLFVDEEGHVVDLVTIYKQEDYILLETSVSKRDEVYSFLEHYHNNDQVVIEDISNELAIIAFEGPYAWKVGQQLIDFDISSLPFQSFVETTWNNEKLIFARTGVTGEYGYKVFVQMESALDLWSFLLDQSEDECVVQPVGSQAVNITMLEVRQPNVDFEVKDHTVFESCFEWLISFEKEEFLAMEAIESLKEQEVEKRLVGFIFDEDAALAEGDSIIIENEKVGSVIQVEYSYTLRKNLGLALMASEFAVSGLEMGGLNSEGNQVVIQTVSSPYITPKSWAIKIV